MISPLVIFISMPTILLYVNNTKAYVTMLSGSPSVSGRQRSHRPARIVNRNEPFGSILEIANSHFSKLLTVLSPTAGRIRRAKRAGRGQ